MKNILEHAVAVEGSHQALAVAVARSGACISKWKREGLPDVWQEILTRRYAHRKAKRKTKSDVAKDEASE